jgi:serine/threonine protein kinase
MSIGSEKNMSILLHNRYELGSILGKGGQATVFRARDTVLNVDRAIKLLSSDMMKNNDARMRFEAEAQVMAKIDHPSVVRLYDIVSSPSVLFLVMDIINGGNIWQWVRKYGPMPEKMVCLAMKDIITAVGVLHDVGVIHRDIKPSNILVSISGSLIITDFGIARFDRPEELQTQTGVVMGTYGYMAPEQLASARFATPQSDIYSLGATIFALCTATLPKDLFMVEHKPQPIAQLSRTMQQIIMKACAYEKERRYANTEEFLDDLQSAEELLSRIPEGTIPLSEEAKIISEEPELPINEEILHTLTIQKSPKIIDFDTEILDTQQTNTNWNKSTPLSGDERTKGERSKSPYSLLLLGLAISFITVTVFTNNHRSELPVLDQSCVDFANVLLERQKEDGGFSGIIQAGPSSWDTGQQRHALIRSKSCGMKKTMKWSDAEEYLLREVPARHALDISWAVLALRSERPNHVDEYLSTLSEYRTSDGMYRFDQEDNTGDWYTTMMAMWALGDSRFITSQQREETLRILTVQIQDVWWSGIDEQLMWIRLDLSERVPEYAPTITEVRDFITRMEERCMLDDGMCTAPRWPNSTLSSGKDRFTLSFHGRPWAIAALSLLHKGAYRQDERVNIILQWLLNQENIYQGETIGNESYRVREHVFALGVYAENLK